MDNQNLEKSDFYEWKIVEDRFVLHENGESSGTFVSYCRGGWQITEGDDLLVMDFANPSDAMNFVNNDRGIEARYDEGEGLKEIIDYLDSRVRRTIDLIENDILDLRSDLVSLKGAKRGMVFMVRQTILDVELQIAYDTIESVKRRYNH